MLKKTLAESLRIAQKHILVREKTHWLHWSFIVVNNKIVEWGCNMRGNPPIHMGYNKKTAMDFPSLLHSEIVAYKRASKLLGKQLKSFEVINIRLSRTGELRLSSPCKCCYPLLSELGATKFYFTTDIGWGKVT